MASGKLPGRDYTQPLQNANVFRVSVRAVYHSCGSGLLRSRQPVIEFDTRAMHNHAAGWIAGVIALFVIYVGMRNSGRFR
jgi:hypothetical protein